MKKSYGKFVFGALIIAVVGVFIVDYFSHKFFSEPMESIPYFFAKAAWYFVFSFLFLSFMNLGKKEGLKVVLGGLVAALIWGMYYNVFPEILNYYPFGMSLYNLTFLGMGIVGTGAAFGAVHTLAFVVGYYINKVVMTQFK